MLPDEANVSTEELCRALELPALAVVRAGTLSEDAFSPLREEILTAALIVGLANQAADVSAANGTSKEVAMTESVAAFQADVDIRTLAVVLATAWVSFAEHESPYAFELLARMNSCDEETNREVWGSIPKVIAATTAHLKLSHPDWFEGLDQFKPPSGR